MRPALANTSLACLVATTLPVALMVAATLPRWIGTTWPSGGGAADSFAAKLDWQSDGRGYASCVLHAASFAAGILYILVLALVGTRLPELTVLATGTLLGAVYNAALAIATYPLCRLVCRGTDKQASFSGQAW